MAVLRNFVRPSVPDPTPAGQALQAHEAMARLNERMAGSRRRFAVIEPAVPPALLAQLQAGPLDELGWSLLAKNAAVASKLRQLLPRFEALLQQAGLGDGTIRIKILK
jgi:hypothetical protein